MTRCKRHLEENPSFTLMEDNTSCHDSWYTNLEREKGLSWVGWPSNLSDFNPIEQIGDLMKSRVQTRREAERVTTLCGMKEALWEEWDWITAEEINKVVAYYYGAVY
jgi:hypothetical protein